MQRCACASHQGLHFPLDNDTPLEITLKKLFTTTYYELIPVCQGVLDLLLCSLIKGEVLIVNNFEEK